MHDVCDEDMQTFSKRIRGKILSDYIGCDEQDLRFSTNTHGKPVCMSHHIHFSISHSDRLFVMIVSNHEIGIDLEKHKHRKNITAIMEEYFHPDETKHYKSLALPDERTMFFYDLWTKKEAYAKYLGVGLQYNFAKDNFLLNTPLQTIEFLHKDEKYSLSIATGADNDKLIKGDLRHSFHPLD